MKKLTRKEKEAIYINKASKLQHIWGNPRGSDWRWVEELTDKELEEAIRDTKGQIRFEIGCATLIFVVCVGLGLLVASLF